MLQGNHDGGVQRFSVVPRAQVMQHLQALRERGRLVRRLQTRHETELVK